MTVINSDQRPYCKVQDSDVSVYRACIIATALFYHQRGGRLVGSTRYSLDVDMRD